MISFGHKSLAVIYIMLGNGNDKNPDGFFTAIALCDGIGAGSVTRLFVSLRRLAGAFIQDKELKYCKRCKRKVDRGAAAFTVGEAYDYSLDREFL